MEQDWIKKNMESLKQLYKENSDEEAISSYIISVIRLLNGMAQIEQGGFHRYEQIILSDSIKLFCDHFREQVQCALNCKEVKDKNTIILDIEDAVTQIAQVYRNIVDSTANADRRMFMSLAVDTSLYEFSPKLCGLYSSMLKKLVKIYSAPETGQQEYAFLMHPTLESNIKAKVLFKKRGNSGKVVVVYVPVRILDQTDLVPVIALHEAFHVLTKKERGRKERAVSFMQIMQTAIKERLFRDVRLCATDMEVDNNRKDVLFEWLFEAVREKFNKCYDEHGEDDRFWYSENLVEYVMEVLVQGLKVADGKLQRDWFGDICKREADEDDESFKTCVEKYNQMYQGVGRIRENLYQIIMGDELRSEAGRYMSIFREAYADVACIYTAQLTPVLYDSAFERSIQFKIPKDDYVDKDKEMRRMLVYDTIIACSDGEFKELWSENKKKCHEEDFSFGDTWFFDEKLLETTGQEDAECDTIPLNYYAYLDYLKGCVGELQRTLTKSAEIGTFRTKLKSILEKQEEVFLDVLSGRFLF